MLNSLLTVFRFLNQISWFNNDPVLALRQQLHQGGITTVYCTRVIAEAGKVQGKDQVNDGSYCAIGKVKATAELNSSKHQAPMG